MIENDKDRRALENHLTKIYLTPKPKKDEFEWLDSPEFHELLKSWENLVRYYRRVDVEFMSMDALFVYTSYIRLLNNMIISASIEEEVYQKILDAKQRFEYGLDEILRQGLMAIENARDDS